MECILFALTGLLAGRYARLPVEHIIRSGDTIALCPELYGVYITIDGAIGVLATARVQ